MEELQRIATYGDFKRELDKTFTGISEGFGRARYLLKQARDTDILKESGYKSVTEFAAAEYNLTETYVSRFIAINDRYSEGGYSDRLQERYQGYGMTKLAEMLTLPEQLADAIPPELSREEIRDVKREIAEEKKITDLEVMLEGQQDTELFLPARAMKQYFYDNPEKYPEMMQALKRDELAEQEEAALDILAPSGSAVLMVRLRGVGKLMISIQGMDRDVEIQNVRTLERETVTWSAPRPFPDSQGLPSRISGIREGSPCESGKGLGRGIWRVLPGTEGAGNFRGGGDAGEKTENCAGASRKARADNE